MEQRRREKVILLVIALVILIFGVLVYAYITTDFLKTPEQLFKKYLMNSVTQISEFNIEPYGEVIERSYEEPIEFTVKIKNTISPDFATSYILGEDKLELSTTAVFKSDIKNKNSDSSINIKNNEKEFFNVNFLTTNNTYGVYIPEMHEKYISVENKDLKKIAQTLELDQETIDNIPETIPDISENFITEEEINKVSELTLKYVNKILEQIDEIDLYTKETYRIPNFDGDYIKGKKYMLTISKVDFHNMLTNIFKELMNEQEFLALLEGKIDEETINSLKQQAEDAKILEKDENSENVVISICEFEGKTIRVRYEETNGKRIEITCVNKENSSHMVAEISIPKSESNDVGYDSIIDFKNVYENNNGQSTLQVKKTYNQKDISAIKSDNISSIFSSILDSNDTEVEKKDVQSYKDIDVTFNLTTTSNENEINSNFTFDGINSNAHYSKPEISLTTKVGSDVQISKLTDNNTIIINDYSKEDFTNLQTEITNNIQKNAIEKPDSLIGILNNAINIYISSMANIDMLSQQRQYSQDEILAANSRFEGCKGEVIGARVQYIFSTLSSNCDYYEYEPEKIPDVVFENTTVSYSLGEEIYKDEISSIMQEIKGKEKYNVEFTYDEIGFIDIIKITKVDNVEE